MDAHPHEEAIYADPAEREHALRLAMWVFLGSETLLFAGLFALYSAYRVAYPLEFALAATYNDQLLGSLNTFVLIVSSFFVAFAAPMLREKRVRTAAVCLVVALFLGMTFLAVKSIEYGHHIAEGAVPGAAYHFADAPGVGSRMFFTLYYCMTGLHALHVVAGMVILAWLARRIVRGRTTAEHHVELELGGLYWHLVDIVWIFLWPLLYLIG